MSTEKRMVSADKLKYLFQRVMHDAGFRSDLETSPESTLASVGVKISDPQVVCYLRDQLLAGNEALLVDGQGKKIFAVATSASIVVAVSTPAFPKGDSGDDLETDAPNDTSQ